MGALPQQGVVQRVQGCWALTRGPWWPPLPIGEDSIFSALPRRIELQNRRGTGVFEKEGWLVRPASGQPSSVHTYSYFAPLGQDTVEIVWTTGFSGLTMRLGVTRDTLRGVAETFWDFPRPTQTTKVVLTRVQCP